MFADPIPHARLDLRRGCGIMQMDSEITMFPRHIQ